jgi:hypothetical protein
MVEPQPKLLLLVELTCTYKINQIRKLQIFFSHVDKYVTQNSPYCKLDTSCTSSLQ